MPSTDLTTALARLLTDATLRDTYRQDRRLAAQRLSVGRGDIDAFCSLDPTGLDNQAKTLLKKRFHEASRILPETCSRLGQDARTWFWKYAQTHWPEGHRRHLEDAVCFCDFLIDTDNRNVCQSELNRLRFALEGRRLAVHLVRDLLVIGGRRRRAIQILYRSRDGTPRQFAFYLKL